MNARCTSSQNWRISVASMNSSAGRRHGKDTHLFRIAAGIFLGAGCLAAVVLGGFYIGRSLGTMLDTIDLIAPADVDPLR